MTRPRLFLIAVGAFLAAGCGLAAATFRPVPENRFAQPLAFVYFASLAAAGTAVAAASAADAIGSRR